MNIFKIKTEDMGDEEYKEYMEKHIDEYLEYNSFITSDVYNHKRKKSVVLVTTHKEYTIIENDCDMIAEKSLYNIIKDIKNKDNIYDIVINFQSIFKHDITEALYILEFSNIMIEYLMPDEFKLPFKIYDEDKLMAYVKVFGNTYKKGR
jgi:hypothetical protein